MKAQLMTISVIVLFVLMLAELIIFVTLGIGYNNIAQSYSTGTSLGSYGTLLTYSSDTFAASSLKAALTTLAGYEYNSSLRGTNLVSDPVTFLSYLITNGVLPDVAVNSIPANFLAAGMGNDTLVKFNQSLTAASLLGASNVIVNETKPVIFQNGPYNLSVRYTENILLNESGSVYRYAIPVNASVPLNGTPDLFYAQQGVLRYINFGGNVSLAGQVGSTQALNGTTDLFGYGAIIASGSSNECPDNSLISQQIILAVDQAPQIQCNGSLFAAIITYNAPTYSPANYVPFIIYPLSSNYIENILQSGQSVLAYGPSLKTLDISALRNAVSNGYYFASPFTPSYLDRITGNFANRSSDGIFTFTGYNRNTARLNGYSSYISGNGVQAVPISNFEWIDPVNSFSTTGNFEIISEFDGSGINSGLYRFGISGTGNLIVWNGAADYNSLLQVPVGQWSFVGFAINSTAIIIYDNGNSQLFSVSGSPVPGTGDNNWILGYQSGTTGEYFNGSMANVQVYNSILTTQQTYKLYQDGLGSLPATGAGLAGWWTLNGNANDYSGNNHNGVATVTGFALPDNYNRDSIFIVPSAQPTFPLPGVLACNNNQQCANVTSPRISIADRPLEYGPGLVASFDPNLDSVIAIQQFNGLPIVTSNSYTFTVWVDGTGPLSEGGALANDSTYVGNKGFILFFAYTGTSQPNIMTLEYGPNHMVLWPAGTNSLPHNTWEMVTGEYNSTSGQASVYLDNSIFATTDLGAGLDAGQLLPLFIGDFGKIGYNSDPFNGLMSDAQLYNQSLTQNQITALYNEGIGGLPIQGQSLMAWWPLDGNANDYSGNGNNGVSYNITFVPFTGYAPVGTATPTAISDEWQALGFGPPPKQSIYWNVTEWTPSSSSVQLLPYSSVSASPTLPQGVNVEAIGGWYAIPNTRNSFLQYPSFATWAYGTSSYAGTQHREMNTVPFPAPFGKLNNDAVPCSSPYGSQGYTATTNMSLTGGYYITASINDAMQIFYRQKGAATWNAVLNSANSWKQQGTSVYSGNILLGPGEYQFAVDYMNVCGSGLSGFSINYYN